MDEKVEKATRAALRRLWDVAYLSRCPLADLIEERTGWRPDGHTLQRHLFQAIEALRPLDDDPPYVRQQQRRYYTILCRRYLEGWDIAEIASHLAISERQYHRELKVAIWMVAEQALGGLW